MEEKKERKRSLDRNIRQCLTYVIKKDGPFRWNKILGFTKEDFLKHMEKEFEEGMTFENYGEWYSRKENMRIVTVYLLVVISLCN